jgi:beta-lactam-binding protein with PASTA domain
MEFSVDPPEQPKPGKKQPKSITDKAKIFLKAIWNFLKSPVFLKNLGAFFLLLVVGFVLLNLGLRWYTNHNESMQVDNYVGMDLEDAERKVRKKDFLVEVKEIYGQPANKVTLQYPDPFSRVKEGRTVYLTIKNGKMEEVKIPDFSNNDNYENYKLVLQNQGLFPKKEEVFDAKLSKNTILKINFKGEELSGFKLREGVKAFKGDTVTCVITTRYSPSILVPKLVCLDYEATTFLLETHELVLGKVFGNFTDQNNAYVWKQHPSAGQQIRKGRQIDIYLTDDFPDGCD